MCALSLTSFQAYWLNLLLTVQIVCIWYNCHYSEVTDHLLYSMCVATIISITQILTTNPLGSAKSESLLPLACFIMHADQGCLWLYRLWVAAVCGTVSTTLNIPAHNPAASKPLIHDTVSHCWSSLLMVLQKVSHSLSLKGFRLVNQGCVYSSESKLLLFLKPFQTC